MNQLVFFLTGLGSGEESGRNLGRRLVGIEEVPDLRAIAMILEHSQTDEGQRLVRANRKGVKPAINPIFNVDPNEPAAKSSS